MKETTLCYIENNASYLMLHRTKKKNDANYGKWIGIGGKIEKGESATECILREIKEETGLLVKNLLYRGRVNFISDIYEDEVMHLFTANSSEALLSSCDEGELKWVKKQDVLSLNLWEGDRVFLKYLIDGEKEFFSLSLIYKGERLADVIKE